MTAMYLDDRFLKCSPRPILPNVRSIPKGMIHYRTPALNKFNVSTGTNKNKDTKYLANKEN